VTTGFERYGKKTRRAAFPEEREQVVPWSALCALVEPHYVGIARIGNEPVPPTIPRMTTSDLIANFSHVEESSEIKTCFTASPSGRPSQDACGAWRGHYVSWQVFPTLKDTGALACTEKS
jgi:hypothetical protein